MLTYLGMPFSHPDPNVVEQRMDVFWQAMGHWVKEGFNMISPMSLHPMFEKVLDLPTDWGYWEDYATLLLQKCDRLMIVAMPGWDISTGVQGEIDLAVEIGIPVLFIDPQTFKVIPRSRCSRTPS